MNAKDLSILIPARNEMFLAKTVENILAHIEADTEIIVVLDGEWADPPIPQHERVNVIYVPKSIGQRAATNLACRLSKAKYVMKCDAHCAFDKGFDRKMREAFQKVGDTVTMVPIMRNLWAFDWKCLKCGKKWYQGPTPTKCREVNFKNSGKPCDSTKFERKIMWIGKTNPQSTSYCFDATPHFQYFEDYKHRTQYEKDKKELGLTETMSLQGSCWMLTREKYWELNICDENFGSWGSQGIEVACKTWLSGGRVLVNHNTWYAHMFRTQGGDFGFPYPISSKDQEKAQSFAKDLFFNNKWDKQMYPLVWLLEKFWPVKGWTEQDLENLKKNTFEFKTSTNALNQAEIEPTAEPVVFHPAEIIVTEIPSPQQSTETTPIYFPEGRASSTFLSDKQSPVPSQRTVSQLESVAIIGSSWIGRTVKTLFPDAYIFDPPKSRSKRAVNNADVTFICLPTTLAKNTQLFEIQEIEECVSWCDSPLIVIRSTVNPGTCDFLARKYNKKILYQPERVENASSVPPVLIIGGNPLDRRMLINLYVPLYQGHVLIRQETAYETEVIKLTENRVIATQLMLSQELFEVCEKAGLDYYTIRDVVFGDDLKFSLRWTFASVDKKDDDLEKAVADLTAWCAWAESLGYQPEITRAFLAGSKQLSSTQPDPQKLMIDHEIPNVDDPIQ